MLKKAVQQGRRRVETGGVAFPPAPPRPELSEQLTSRMGYVEDFDESRTMLADFFSILLESDANFVQVPE